MISHQPAPTTATTSTLPRKFFDSHHHFLDTTISQNGATFQAFLRSVVPDEVYLPSQYQRDVVEPLKAAGVTVVGSTHVECMPDDGVAEVAWIEALSPTSVQAIVASTDLASPNINDELMKLRQASPEKLKGIRWILDCVGKFDKGGGNNTATHVATSRHDGIDYLRRSNGTDGYDGSVMPDFERGFALLESHGLSFDLQCAPVQLPAAAALFAKYPKIPVVIDHLGKPRMLLGPDHESATTPNQQELHDWRTGMKAMAALPHVYVKISMLGYSVPGWIRNQTRMDLVRQLVRETVALFGPQRCMVATNFWKNAAMSDSDGLSNVGPDSVQLLTLLYKDFLGDYSEQDKQAIFSGTAKLFYKIND